MPSAGFSHTYRNVDEGFSFISGCTGFIFHHEFPIVIEYRFLLFIRDIRQVLGKDFHGFGNRDIASVVPTNDMFALHVRDENSRGNHFSGTLTVFTNEGLSGLFQKTSDSFSRKLVQSSDPSALTPFVSQQKQEVPPIDGR